MPKASPIMSLTPREQPRMESTSWTGQDGGRGNFSGGEEGRQGPGSTGDSGLYAHMHNLYISRTVISHAEINKSNVQNKVFSMFKVFSIISKKITKEAF